MKTDPRPEIDLAEPGPLKAFARAWNHFWFDPADPTTLGLIRILAGILVVYIHLAYSFDLQEFFGKNAWAGIDYANRDRKEAPFLTPSRTWSPQSFSVILPEDPDVRADLVRFLRETMADPQARAAVVGYLNASANQADPPPNIRIPTSVLNMRADLQSGHPNSRRSLARLMDSLTDLDKPELERTLSFMDEWRFDPREIKERGGALGHTMWSVWFHVTEPGWMVFIHVCVILVMIAFTVGFCTRITSVLTWVAAISYIQRSQYTLFGGDTMMNILLLYLMIGPSGAALSVDRLLRRWWEVRQAKKEGRPIPEWKAPEPVVAANLAIRLLQVHMCIIYLSSGTSKLLGGSWWNGTAIYYTFANYEFSPLRYSFFQSFLRWLCGDRWLWEIVMEGGSYFTLMLEIGFPFLVWNKRLRPFFVTGALMLHTGIALFMGLFAFQMLMGVIVLSFVPSSLVRRLLSRWIAVPTVPPAAGKTDDQEPPAPESAQEKEVDTRVKKKLKMAN